MHSPTVKGDSPVNYRALLAIPGFGRLAAGTFLGRMANQMFEIALVLFVLQRFHSPTLAGLTIFMSIVPGLLVSPLAGALLDRHGRVRLIILDHFLAATVMTAIVALSLTGHLTPYLLVPMVGVMSLTAMLSGGGIRSLVPLLLPRHLWGRGNAVDSSGYMITSILGPAIGGVLVGLVGGEATLAVVAVTWAVTAFTYIGIPDPRAEEGDPGASLFRSALGSVGYVLGNRTLRGLAASMSLSNVGYGMMIVLVPVLVLQHLHGNSAQVGGYFAASGAVGTVAGLVYGHHYREGGENRTVAVTGLVSAGSVLLLAFSGSYAMVLAAGMIFGLSIGPGDVSMFSLRQRRTEVAWLGRAMAISMSLNYAGSPIGSALAGPLLAVSLRMAFIVAAIIAASGALLALVAIPGEDPVGELQPV
jgi:MFS family permease